MVDINITTSLSEFGKGNDDKKKLKTGSITKWVWVEPDLKI